MHVITMQIVPTFLSRGTEKVSGAGVKMDSSVMASATVMAAGKFQDVILPDTSLDDVVELPELVCSLEGLLLELV